MIGNYTLFSFYRSKEWCLLLMNLRHKRVNNEGLIVCEYCGKPIVNAYDCIGHHKIELTEANVNDVNISLNEDNIMLVHHKCHNIIHNKLAYGGNVRKVYLVYGAPLSGKRKWVDNVKNNGDLIIDIDNVWQCVSGCERGVKSGRLKAVVFGVRDYLLDCVRYRRGKWLNAYIIGGYPLSSERERLLKELSAEEIYIDSTKEQCMLRVDDLNCSEDMKKEYVKYIEDWFRQYIPPL